MSSLISKPGITRLSTSSGVPKEWSQSWFRDFISDHLKGADVRNAVGKNGITISGNLTTPFGTIGLAGPVSFNSPDNTNALTINDPGPIVNGITAIAVTHVGTPVGFIGSGTATFLSAGATDFGIASVDGGNLLFGTAAAGAANIRGSVSVLGVWGLNAPSPNNPTIIINGATNTANTFTARIISGSAAGFSSGLNVDAGTNTNDSTMLIRKAGGGAIYLQIRGDGATGFFGGGPGLQVTGYGTPTGGSHQPSFAAGTITLANLAAAVAQLIIDLKSYGLIGA